MSFVHVVNAGPLVFAMGAAALVGLIGFLSPCVLPLVPGYLSYVAGLSDRARGRRHTVAGACLFVVGFTLVVAAQGVVLGGLGALLRDHAVGIQRGLGVFVVVMGVAFLGHLPWLQRTFGIRWRPRAGLAGAPLLGATFGLAWGPCLTPTIGAVFAMAYTEQTAPRGAALVVAYCLGLGVPFVLVAIGFDSTTRALAFVRRRTRAINLAGGAALVAIGVLMLTGQWAHLMDWLRTSTGPNGVGAGL
jgi:cytochrome c-type biogenesis protein